MAVIRFLHWNIQTLSNNKINNGNGAQIIAFIAAVAHHVNANMISIIEVKHAAAANLTNNLVGALQLANGNLNHWNAVVSARTPNNEAYYVLWETGNNFVGLPSAALGGPNPNQGYDLTPFNPPPNILPFPGRLTGRGGRRPYFIAFHTTDTNHDFSVMVFHAMFGFFTPIGVGNIGRLRTVTQVDNGTGVLVPMDAGIVSGDFNVDLIGSPADYANLVNNVGNPVIDPAAFMDQRAAKTSMVDRTPVPPFGHTLDYRANAYDNVFVAAAATANAQVTDLIVESATLLGVQGAFVPIVTNFNAAFIRNAQLLNNALPPQDLEDAWHVVRDQVSNHLPVSVHVTV